MERRRPHDGRNALFDDGWACQGITGPQLVPQVHGRFHRPVAEDALPLALPSAGQARSSAGRLRYLYLLRPKSRLDAIVDELQLHARHTELKQLFVALMEAPFDPLEFSLA